MLIVISARGCGLVGLGPYGNEWIATPNLDQLAAEGEVYDSHYSATPCPVAVREQWWAKLPAGAVLVRNSRPMHRVPVDVEKAFAEVIDAQPDPVDPLPMDALLRALPAVLERFPPLVWIETDQLLAPWTISQGVFEVYLEELTDGEEPEADAEPISPWNHPPVGWFDRDDRTSWELLHRSYAAAITDFDADLGRVFRLLRERGLAETATWAFTADFGFPLGEHGILGPFRPYLHDEFVHVPLIVRRPNATNAGYRHSPFTESADVLAILGGEPVPERDSIFQRWEMNGLAEAALRTHTHALLLPLRYPDDEDRGEPMLFVKPDDRWEVNDLRQAEMNLADELEAELRAKLKPDSE